MHMAKIEKIVHPSKVVSWPDARGLDFVLSTLLSMSLSKISFITQPIDLTKMLPIKIIARTSRFEITLVEITAAASAGQKIR